MFFYISIIQKIIIVILIINDLLRNIKPLSGECSVGHLQDGRYCDENARGRIDAGKENWQDIQTNGQEQRWPPVVRRIHRRSQKRPVYCSAVAVQSWRPVGLLTLFIVLLNLPGFLLNGHVMVWLVSLFFVFNFRFF